MWAVWQKGRLALWIVGFWWTSGGQLLEMGVLEGAVVGVVRLLPSGIASGPLRILSEHFQL